MTSRERVLTAMRRGQPDRVPVNIRGVRVWDPEWVATRDVSYRPLIAAIDGYCDIIPVAGVGGADAHFLTSATAEVTETLIIDAGDWDIHRTTIHTPKGDLSQDYWVSKLGDLPLTKKHFVVTPDDAERVLSVPYVMADLDFSAYLELRAGLAGQLCKCASAHTPERRYTISSAPRPSPTGGSNTATCSSRCAPSSRSARWQCSTRCWRPESGQCSPATEWSRLRRRSTPPRPTAHSRFRRSARCAAASTRPSACSTSTATIG